jgi:phosphate:Na+ symporter
MQSSTAAIAVTLSALYAGAVGLDQAVALVIGQNIGTATSSAMAAVGASSTAKRLAVAYIAFKLIAAVVALLLFLPIIRVMIRAAASVDAVTLLAIYHTGYNVVGVAILLPLIVPFTRMIERIVPERGNPLTRSLDPASLASFIVAVEAGRRTVARVLGALCSSATDRLESILQGGAAAYTIDNAMQHQTSDALLETRAFLSHVTDHLPSDEEQRWFISTLHALEHTIRLADAIKENVKIGPDGVDERRAVALCAKAMRSASSIATLLIHSPLPKSDEPRRTEESAMVGVGPVDTDATPAVSPR